MDHLSVQANEYEYKEGDREAHNGINNDEMRAEIIKELTAMEKTNAITSNQVLSWEKV